jgi:hypothetical protein
MYDDRLDYSAFRAPAVLLSGTVDYAMYNSFRDQLGRAPEKGIVVIELSRSAAVPVDAVAAAVTSVPAVPGGGLGGRRRCGRVAARSVAARSRSWSRLRRSFGRRRSAGSDSRAGFAARERTRELHDVCAAAPGCG